jgi:hypothetical protein
MKLMDALEMLFDGDNRLASKDVPPHAEAAFHEARAAYFEAAKERALATPESEAFCEHGVWLGDANPNRPCPECREDRDG